MASLEISLRLSERTFDIRRDLLETPAALEEYYCGNPGLRELFEGVGGVAAAFRPFANLKWMRDLFDNAAARDIYNADFQRLVRDVMDGRPIPDPDS